MKRILNQILNYGTQKAYNLLHKTDLSTENLLSQATDVTILSLQTKWVTGELSYLY